VYGVDKELQSDSRLAAPAHFRGAMPMNASQDVGGREIKILAWLFVVSWLSQVFYLIPIPDLAKWGSTDPIAAVKAESWVAVALLTSFGVVAGLVALTRKIGVALMLLSSLAFVVVWWLFSGYFDRSISLPKLFADMWSFATLNGRELVFVHKDVVLNAFYHALIPVLAYVIYRRSARKAVI